MWIRAFRTEIVGREHNFIVHRLVTVANVICAFCRKINKRQQAGPGGPIEHKVIFVYKFGLICCVSAERSQFFFCLSSIRIQFVNALKWPKVLYTGIAIALPPIAHFASVHAILDICRHRHQHDSLVRQLVSGSSELCNRSEHTQLMWEFTLRVPSANITLCETEEKKVKNRDLIKTKNQKKK